MPDRVAAAFEAGAGEANNVSSDRVAAAFEEGAGEPAGFEKFFAGMFSAIGASPEQVGLDRFDRSKFPELYPATLTEFAEPVETDDDWAASYRNGSTLTEFAEPVETDDDWAAIFRPLLAKTSLQTRGVQLAFDADRDGPFLSSLGER
ncbi:hypothetical protein T484DRAFT_1773184 [Baffinella frigidus]|nr:hypothetical protein T484DRAFT_1773184 [Cryptophyta sp. CCMP2293]